MQFKSAKTLFETAESYFAICVQKEEPPTVSGLAKALGFSSRLELLQYNGKYKEQIKRVLLSVEEYCEQKLFDKTGISGAKFSLANNFKGWDESVNRSCGTSEKIDEILIGINNGMKSG